MTKSALSIGPAAAIKLLILAALLTLSACSRPTAEKAAAPNSAHENEIQWNNGDVSAALAAARREGKPVLLFWGAIWCPYCQQLKATVFTRPDFIAKSRLFVPVYLDGDEAGAQKWGEEFHVQGYPTLVILDTQRHEVMRLAGGMDLSQYVSVIDAALADLQPIDVTLVGIRDSKSITANTCTRLGFNAWTLDDLQKSEFAGRAAQLTDAAQSCAKVAPLASARLEIFAAYFQAQAEKNDIEHGKPPSARLQSALGNVQRVLVERGGDAKLADALQSLDKTFFAAVKAAGTGIAPTMRDSYIAAMDAEMNDGSLAEADHLAALRRKLQAARVLSPDGKVPEPYARDARARIDAALRHAQTPQIRSGIVNAALNIYDELQLHQEAYDLVKAELPRAEHKYYLEADLADIAETLGRKDEALALWHQAYVDAQGAATRFQWGVNYASALLRLQPHSSRRIEEITLQVLGELNGPDRIYRRARSRLERLDGELRAWNREAEGEHAEILHAIHTHMRGICGNIPEDESARRSCEGFLVGA